MITLDNISMQHGRQILFLEASVQQWQDPTVVWETTQSLGLGVYFEGAPTEAGSPTWVSSMGR
jgi:hypothetical protein